MNTLLPRGNSNARKAAFDLILKNRSFPDIAKQAGIPEAEVRQIKALCIAKLREDHFRKFQTGAKADGPSLITGKEVPAEQAEREFAKFLANLGIVDDAIQGKAKG